MLKTENLLIQFKGGFKMNHISTWLSGIGILIFVYLVLRNGDESVNIIKAIANSGTSAIKTLQGRD